MIGLISKIAFLEESAGLVAIFRYEAVFSPQKAYRILRGKIRLLAEKSPTNPAGLFLT